MQLYDAWNDAKSILLRHTYATVLPRKYDSISRFSKCPKTTDIYVEVTKPPSGRGNHDRRKGGSQVTLMWSDEVHVWRSMRWVVGSTKHFNTGDCCLFPVSYWQSTFLLRHHTITFTMCLLLSPWWQSSPNLKKVTSWGSLSDISICLQCFLDAFMFGFFGTRSELP